MSFPGILVIYIYLIFALHKQLSKNKNAISVETYIPIVTVSEHIQLYIMPTVGTGRFSFKPFSNTIGMEAMLTAG